MVCTSAVFQYTNKGKHCCPLETSPLSKIHFLQDPIFLFLSKLSWLHCKSDANACLESECLETTVKYIVENYNNSKTVEQFVMFTNCKMARKTHVQKCR